MLEPGSNQYLVAPLQTARVSAALPAAGAYDATPLEMHCPGFAAVSFYCAYDEDAQALNGEVSMIVEVSPYSVNHATLPSWFRTAVYASGVVAGGADVNSLIQRDIIAYDPAGAAVEGWVFGPLELWSTVQRIRVRCAETGDPNTPGVVSVVALFGVM